MKTAASAGQSRYRFLVMAVTLIAFALRAYDLGAQSLWGDEGYTVVLPGQAEWDIPSAMPFGSFSFYYHLVHTWIPLAGGSELALRFPSLGAGVLLVPAGFVLGRRLGTPLTGLGTALLTAVSPALIGHSQTARPYSLLVLVMALNLLAVLRIGGGSQALRWWVLAAATQIVAASLHLFSLAVVPPTLLTLGWRAWRDPAMRRRFVVVAVCIVAALLPWIVRSSADTYSEVADRAVGVSLSPLAFANAVWSSLLIGESARPDAGMVSLFGGAVFISALIGGFFLWRRSRRLAILAALYALVPLTISYVIDLRVPFFNGRYVLYLAPLLFVLMAGALGPAIRGRVAVLAAPLLFIGVIWTLQVYQQAVAPKEDLRSLAIELRRRLEPGDLLMTNSGWRQMNLSYYLQGVDVPILTISQERAWTLDGIRTAVQPTISARERIWVVFFGAPPESATHALEPFLSAESYARVSDHRYGTTRLALYQRVPDRAGDHLPSSIAFGDALELLDYNGPSLQSIQPGGGVALDLKWRLQKPGDYAFSLRLVDRHGEVWAQADGRPRNGYLSTATGTSGAEIVEARGLTIPWGTPPGVYDLRVAAYDDTSGVGLVAKDPTAKTVDPAWTLGTIEVLPAETAPNVAILPIQEHRHDDLGTVRLLGGSWSTQTLAGEDIAIALFWQPQADVKKRLLLEISLADDHGKIWGSARSPLQSQSALNWHAGELRLGKYQVRVQPGAPAGRYHLLVQVVSSTDGAQASDRLHVVHLGDVDVTTRPQRSTAVGVQHRLHVVFGGQIELLGYDLGDGRTTNEQALPAKVGEELQVDLYWRVASGVGTIGIDDSYTVFVQLLDASGRLVAQHDGIPSGGAAPTVTWAPGEVVEDRHALALPNDLPAGRYTLITGLYNGKTMRRLPTEHGDHLALGQVVVE